MIIVGEQSKASNAPASLYKRGETALGKQLSEIHTNWLLMYCIHLWQRHYSECSTWRTKLAEYEKRADDDYSTRKSQVDTERTDAPRPIFERENNTLGIVSSAVDQVFAKGKSEIFGTKPWLAATPQQPTDSQLAEDITRHSQWKADQSNFEPTLTDAIKLALDLGTVFVKCRWLREEETYVTKKPAAFSKSRNAPLKREDGENVHTDEDMPAEAMAMGGDVEWRDMDVEETRIFFNNIEASNLDFKDVAFDPAAPELDLRYTPFFCRFKMGVHDLVSSLNLDDDQKRELVERAMAINEDLNPRAHRGEHSNRNTFDLDPEANPQITLIEGFVRCDPMSTGKPIRLRVVFSPDMNVLLHAEYLSAITPDGILPIFPVRCFKVPRRIIGKGYRERFEKAEDCVDGMYNAIVVRQRESADVYTGFNAKGLKDGQEGKDVVNSPTKIFELAEDVDDIAKVFTFAVKPDNSERTDQLLQQMNQMLQLRLGTISASQGGMTGIPSNDTATGSKLIHNQVDTVTGCQIDQIMKDLEKPVQFFVILNYANQDFDETFMWGEGKDAVPVIITAKDVQGLKANVSLTLTQSQNLQKLEAAKAAIDIGMKYAGLPEDQKAGQRLLFVQALKGLGFDDADKIVREAVMDVAGIGAMLPENVRPAFEQWLATQGMGAAPEDSQGPQALPDPQAGPQAIPA